MLSEIQEKEEYQDLLDKDRAILLKHSNTCPVSAKAYEEVQSFCEDVDIPCHYVVVQESRELSNYVEESLGIKHESPQVFLFKDGDVKWHDSHYLITEDNLKTELEKIS